MCFSLILQYNQYSIMVSIIPCTSFIRYLHLCVRWARCHCPRWIHLTEVESIWILMSNQFNGDQVNETDNSFYYVITHGRWKNFKNDFGTGVEYENGENMGKWNTSFCVLWNPTTIITIWKRSTSIFWGISLLSTIVKQK